MLMKQYHVFPMQVIAIFIGRYIGAHIHAGIEYFSSYMLLSLIPH